MKKTIRNGIFETNSSSVHSMVIKRDTLLKDAAWYEDRRYREIDDDEPIELEKNKIPISEKGTIWGHFGVFDRDYRIFSSQEEKLAYLLTLCYYANDCDFDEMLESSSFGAIESAIRRYTGAQRIKFSSKVERRLRETEDAGYYYDSDYCYIDHQSAPWNRKIEFIDINSYDAVTRFIWGKGVCLRTSSD